MVAFHNELRVPPTITAEIMLHLLNPYLILASVFCIGIGFAFNAPAWTSIVPQVVSDEELPSAATLTRPLSII
jgi:hypothetical protein